MRMLYLCYWSIDDGLTHSTVFPQLRVLAEMKQIDRLILCTIERGQHPVNYTGPRDEKISFYPLYSKSIKLGALNKIVDFILFPAMLKNLARMHDIDFILSRGTPAGSLAWKVFRKTGIPFGVESFEPHAEYMLESDVWKKSGLKYHAQKKWEDKQKQAAQFLITVSHNYREQLLAEGLPEEKVYTIPCTVDTDTFVFDTRQRAVIRERLQIPEGYIVGVYVGKFGDIYYEDEAFEIMKKAFDFYGEQFFMIVLTPDDKTALYLKIEQFGMNINRFFIDRVPHSEVPHYLSAADFAFSFVKPVESRKFCSPIKHGEYWANGLPIIMGEGIGDDSDIINNNPICGVIHNSQLKHLDEIFSGIKSLLAAENRSLIASIAKKHRNRNLINTVFLNIFDSLFKSHSTYASKK